MSDPFALSPTDNIVALFRAHEERHQEDRATIARLLHNARRHEESALYQHHRILDLRQALSEACGVIERLADQQAMTDDFYQPSLARFKTVISGEPL